MNIFRYNNILIYLDENALNLGEKTNYFFGVFGERKWLFILKFARLS